MERKYKVAKSKFTDRFKAPLGKKVDFWTLSHTDADQTYNPKASVLQLHRQKP